MATENGHLSLVVQRVINEFQTPADEDFQLWALTALEHSGREGLPGAHELTIRLVGETESRELNARYRKKDKATNVLSFPSDLPEQLHEELVADSGSMVLGDLVICAPVVNREAQEQNKPERDHWAHLVMHGVLHLLGYDHVEPGQAEQMENLERKLLAGLGINDPYLVR